MHLNMTEQGDIVKNSWRKEADNLLSKLTEHGVVVLDKDQTPPMPSVVKINYTLGRQIYHQATTDMIDKSFRRVINLDGTPVKEG